MSPRESPKVVVSGRSKSFGSLKISKKRDSYSKLWDQN